MAHEEAMTDGERCGFRYYLRYYLRYYQQTSYWKDCPFDKDEHPIRSGHPFQPSLSARETAEVRTNPASGDRPDTVTHTPGLGTSASKRADNLLPLWCLPALVPP